MKDLQRADLRGFIRDKLNGQLFGALFNKQGAAFAGYYYGEARQPLLSSPMLTTTPSDYLRPGAVSLR